jgi:hypothetical protein
MAMPEKETTRAYLLDLVAYSRRQEYLDPLAALAPMLLALADAEWAREEAAEAQALLAADLANQAEREGA